MVEAFRGAAKSWISACYALYWLYWNPNDNVVIVSANKERSDAFTTFCLRLINEIPFLAHMRPRQGQRQSMVGFDIGTQTQASQTQSVVSVGIFGMMTGKRANLIIADDIEVPNNSETATMREKLAERIKEFSALLKPDTPGKIVFLGTPQTEDTVYRVLPDRGFSIRIWPIVYPDEAMQAVYGACLAPMLADAIKANPRLAGTSTEPTRFTEREIESRRLEYGRAGFALQFLLDPRLADEDMYPLRVRDLMVWDLVGNEAPQKMTWTSDPQQTISELPMVGMKGDRWVRAVVAANTPLIAYEGTVMAIDPAGRGKDETGVAVVSQLHGLVFIREVKGLSGYGPETLREIALMAKQYGVNRILVEANFGDGMFSQLLKPVLGEVHPCFVEEVKHSTQKEKRIIDVLEPVLSSHRAVIDAALVERDYRSTAGRPIEDLNVYRLIFQLTRITREKGSLRHDDRLDALSMAVGHWTQSMARNVQRAVQKTQEKAWEETLKQFCKGSPFGADKRRTKRVRTMAAKTMGEV